MATGVRELDLADALVTQFNSELTLDPAAVRAYVLPLKREDLAARKITLWPNSKTTELQNRAANVSEIEINVAVQKAVDPTDKDAVDALVQVVQSIKDLFGEDGALREADLADCMFVGISQEPLFLMDHLIEQRVFTSIFQLRFNSPDE